MRPVFLIGFMGAGKTTVGRLLASRMGIDFVDLDQEVAAREGESVDAIFRARGEVGFRLAERSALSGLATRENTVVACGGGVVTDEGSRSILETAGTTVYLAVSPEDAMARIGSETGGRPLLSAEPDSVAGLLASREALYLETARFAVDTSGLSAEQVAERVGSLLGGPDA